MAAQGDAEAAISSAKAELKTCYAQVKQVEAKGANVNGLVAMLNGAGQLLTEAELAYLAGNYSSAFDLAQQSKAQLSGFDAKASTLKNDALRNENLSFYRDALLVAAAVVIFCVGIAVWFVLGKNKFRSVNVQ